MWHAAFKVACHALLAPRWNSRRAKFSKFTAVVGGPQPGPSGWAQAGPKWVGPSWAQVGGPPGPSGLAQAGPKWVGPSWAQARNLGPKKIQKIKILKIKIRVAQNVGKVWISRKKNLPAPFGAIPGHFLCGPEKSKKCEIFVYFPWWAPRWNLHYLNTDCHLGLHS